MKNECDWRAISRENTEFFGNVSASISHEINNRLAVIAEKAGLIEDLAMMLAHGKGVDPGRFEVQGRRIVEQVRDTKNIVGNLNRFAHSADAPISRIDAAALLAFVVELYQRKAGMAEIALSGPGSIDPLMITTCPFTLENLIGRCIDTALVNGGKDGAVEVGVEEAPGGLRFRFAGLALGSESPEPTATSDGVTAILDCLGARLRSDPATATLLLDVPDHHTSNQGGEHD
jgi:hypothetical protein